MTTETKRTHAPKWEQILAELGKVPSRVDAETVCWLIDNLRESLYREKAMLDACRAAADHIAAACELDPMDPYRLRVTEATLRACIALAGGKGE